MKATVGTSWVPRLLGASALFLLVALAASVSAQPSINEWGVPTPNSQPGNIVSDAFGDLWFTEIAGNKIGRITQNGVVVERDVPTAGSQPWGIAIEPNGRIWFTEAAGNKIGNVTPGGMFGQDNIPTADSQPRGIAIDASGNVWFAESNANKIGKFVPSSSSFTEYNVPTANSQPWAVAVDASGNVWFTERAGNKLGRLLASSGQFEEYAIPTSGSSPTGLAIDASGNVWVAGYDSNKIAMRTPTGVWTEYEIPIGNSKPTWLAVDRAGGVWYAGSGSNSFGRVFGGTVTPYGVPTANSMPFGIAVDNVGNVWFTEQSANKIAKAIALAPVATPTPTPIPVPTSTPAPRDNRYFSQTGFRIDNDVFWDYFNKRGGVRTFGYPVSRTFTFLGFTTQFFQRSIMQLGPDGGARTMNVLDPGLMPYTRINGSTFPAPDSYLATLAPAPGSPDYASRVQEFVMKYAPNQYEGMNVNFYQAFRNTVTMQDAFPHGGGNTDLLPGLNLEMWGVPTSYPQRDPNNHNFVYLRFQRGIMHYDATNGYTQGLLLADYLKSIMTGSNLPSDLESQARDSRFYRQYNPSRANWIERPDQLPGTDLTFAFEKQ